MRTLEHHDQNMYSIDDLARQMKPGGLFLGRGFEWTVNHAQAVSDLYRDSGRLAAIKKQRKGATFLHGVGVAAEGPLFLFDAESKGHVHIVGTTGSGKTRLFDLLITQTVLRHEPCIIIDPKGDRELQNNAEAAYIRAGRHGDFSFFHPAFVDESAAINPLASRQRSSELASRLAALIPAKMSGDVFQAFSNNALQGIFYALERSGVNPTIMDVQRALSEGFGPLCIRALEGWAYAAGAGMVHKLHQAMANGRGGNTADAKAVR